MIFFTKLLSSIALLCIIGVQTAHAVDYGVGVGFLPMEGAKPCNNAEVRKVEAHIKDAMDAAGFPEIARANWLSFEKGELVSVTDGGRQLAGGCDYCKYGLWGLCATYCPCWPGCQRRLLRGLNQKQLTDAVEEIRVNIALNAGGDKSVKCVDVNNPQVVVFPVDL